MIPNNALTLNKTKNARLDTLIALSLQLCILEQSLLHASFYGNISDLRRHQCIKYSFAALVDKHDTEEVFTIRRCSAVSQSLCLAGETERLTIFGGTLSAAWCLDQLLEVDHIIEGVRLCFKALVSYRQLEEGTRDWLTTIDLSHDRVVILLDLRVT